MQHIQFNHTNHSHCESGAATNLLNHYGVKITEPLSFGIGAGLFFIHVPFLKVSGVPGTNYRSYPGLVFKNLMKGLGVQYHMQQFGNDKAKAKAVLDQQLQLGNPVGMISSVYYLNYLPEIFRFHFNAHSLVGVGTDEDGKYIISDPVMDQLAHIEYDELERARFAKGALAPKGKLYYITKVPQSIDFETAIRKGIRLNIKNYLIPFIPYIGNNGIHTLAKRVADYPKKLTDRKASLYLGNIIRMQEEIGTGGGGFRFLYAAFLQQSADIIQVSVLKEFSERMTKIGDDWRNFALEASRLCKGRNTDVAGYQHISQLLHEIGYAEKKIFEDLKKLGV